MCFSFYYIKKLCFNIVIQVFFCYNVRDNDNKREMPYGGKKKYN